MDVVRGDGERGGGGRWASMETDDSLWLLKLKIRRFF